MYCLVCILGLSSGRTVRRFLWGFPSMILSDAGMAWGRVLSEFHMASLNPLCNVRWFALRGVA